MKKKILVLSSFPAPYRVAVFAGLAEEYDLDVVFGTCSDQDRSKDWFISKSEFRYYIVTEDEGREKLKKCMQQIRTYDLVLAYDWYLPFALKIELLALLFKVPYVINCDGAFIGKKNVKDLIKRFFVRNATACLASGVHAKEYYLNYGAKEANVFVHDFTSLTEADILAKPLSQDDKGEIKKRLGLADGVVVLSIGQFIHRKGFDLLLEAWKEVDNLGQLVIVGGGSEKKKYEQFIKENGLKNVLLLDFMNKERVFEYYKACDLFVLPTREDIWGLVINEAMACGLPVITTDKCIAGLELLNAERGLSIVKCDSKSILGSLKILLENQSLREKIGEQNLNNIIGKTYNNLIRQTLAVLHNIMKGQV